MLAPDLVNDPLQRLGVDVLWFNPCFASPFVDAGYDVTGVHLALARNPQTYRSGARGCCTLEDARAEAVYRDYALLGTLLGMPSAQGLFRRAIPQSGAANHVSSRDTATAATSACARSSRWCSRSTLSSPTGTATTWRSS